MKYDYIYGKAEIRLSRPARGGWIEIWCSSSNANDQRGPAPHGAGGLKYRWFANKSCPGGPAPHGAGGLKFEQDFEITEQPTVPPRTGRVD